MATTDKKKKGSPPGRQERKVAAEKAASREEAASIQEEERPETESARGDDDQEWIDLDGDQDDLSGRVFKAFDGFVPGVIRRATASSVGQALLNEDRVKTLLSENKKIPKEVAGLLLSQADGLRKEVLRAVSGEIRVFLENVDLGGEIAKILTSVSFEVKTEVRFVPNDQAVRSDRRKDSESPEEDSPRALKLRWGSRRRGKPQEGAEGEGEDGDQTDE